VVLILPDGRTVRAAELDERSAIAAHRLAAHGLVPGDRVLMSAQTSLDLVLTYVGALRLGLVVVPTNTAYRARELQHIVSDARPKAAIIDDPERAAWLESFDAKMLVTSPQLALPDGDPITLDSARAETPALLCYTSGTTGAPKGAVLRHGNLLASS